MVYKEIMGGYVKIHGKQAKKKTVWWNSNFFHVTAR